MIISQPGILLFRHLPICSHTYEPFGKIAVEIILSRKSDWLRSTFPKIPTSGKLLIEVQNFLKAGSILPKEMTILKAARGAMV